MGLHFSVSSGNDSFADLRIRYPLAYGNDEPGDHQFLVCASRDLVQFSDFDEALCECRLDLAYESRRSATKNALRQLQRCKTNSPSAAPMGVAE